MPSSTSPPPIKSALPLGEADAQLIAHDVALGAFAVRLDTVYHDTLKTPRPPSPRPSLKDYRLMFDNKFNDYMYLLLDEGSRDTDHTRAFIYAFERALSAMAAHIASVSIGITEKMIEEDLINDMDEFGRVMDELKAVIDGAREIARDIMDKDLRVKN